MSNKSTPRLLIDFLKSISILGVVFQLQHETLKNRLTLQKWFRNAALHSKTYPSTDGLHDHFPVTH